MNVAEHTQAANAQKIASLYVIEFIGGEWLHLTGWRDSIKVKNLPSILGGGEKVFLTAQITHSPIKQVVGIEAQGTTITTGVDNKLLRRVFLVASTNKVRVHVLRVNLESEQQTYDYNRHCYIMESGVISVVAVNGNQIECSLVPEVLAGGGQIPRAIFSRTCWKVFGQCGVNLELIKTSSQIASVIRASRMVVLNAAIDITRLAHGSVYHPATGQRLTIEWADNSGPGGVSRLRLRGWSPDFKAGDNLTIYPGCMLSTASCESWGNAPNFGGFSFVPTANPVTAGG